MYCSDATRVIDIFVMPTLTAQVAAISKALRIPPTLELPVALGSALEVMDAAPAAPLAALAPAPAGPSSA